MQNYVIYKRVSTKKQGNSGLGLAAQQQLLDNYLKTREHNIIGSFEEVESGKKNNRIELNKALALCQTKKATLLVAKLGRLSRNAAFTMKLKDSNIDIVCCDMPEADKLTIGVMALINQNERERISERTKQALAIKKIQLAKEGKRLGNPNPPTEAQKQAAKDSLKLIAETNPSRIAATKVIKDKIELALFKEQTLTYKDLAEDLNLLGIKRVRSKDSLWTEKNARYIALSILKDFNLKRLPKFN